MRMIVVALIGGAVIGFLDGTLFAEPIREWVTSPTYQTAAVAGVAAFLGVIWGWVGKALVGSRARD